MPAETSAPTLPFFTRLWLAWVVYFRVIFDGAFAARVEGVRHLAALPPKSEVPRTKRSAGQEDSARALPAAKEPATLDAPAAPAKPSATDGALQLLAILQRDGRLVDFLEQDITSFKDDEVGAAARAVHEGCRKGLHAHAKLEPLRTEEEGDKITLAAGFSPAEVKLSGDVRGSAPYAGVLRHRGWRARDVSLPTPVKGHDASVVAPAEVEL